MTTRDLRILAIDDQQPILHALQDALAESGCQVLTATGGPAGLALAAAERPDVVLLDIRMPGMGGLEVLQVLKQDPATAALPVILLTGEADAELMRQAFALGADDYLRKPFNPVELQIRVSHHAQLKQAADEIHRLQELNRLKEDFIAVLSHELRTPLTPLIGYAELLLSGLAGPLNPEQRELQTVILDRACDLHRLLEGLLEYNQIKAGMRRIQVRPLLLAHEIGAAVEPLRAKCRRMKQVLELQLPSPDPQVHADPAALRRVIALLLDNAIKFTPPGGRIIVRASAEDDQLCLSVSDTGIGIPAASLPRVFDTFRQLEGHATRSFEGLGMGLAVARHLVELHSGRIWAESKEGQGTTFRVRLPAGGSPDADPAPGNRETRGASDRPPVAAASSPGRCPG